MSTAKEIELQWILIALLLVSSALHVTAAQTSGSLNPFIVITEVGGSRVDESRIVNLQRQVINVFGYARNCQNGELLAVIKPAAESQWHLYGPVKASPGGVFQIDEIRFPEPGEYTISVALFAPGTHAAGVAISEAQLTLDALAISRSINIFITVPSRALLPPAGSEYQDQTRSPDFTALDILSVGHRTVQPNQSTVVEASGDVVIAARNLSASTKVYLALHAPHSEICYIRGPGIYSLQDNYVLPGVSFEVPGNPLQLHLELLAFVSRYPIPAGPMNWALFQASAQVISPPISITIEAKPPQTDTRRIPIIEIVQIDGQELRPVYPSAGRAHEPQQSQAAAIHVHQGATLEVAYKGLAEGTRLWVLTRTQGTHAWLAQGPMQIRTAFRLTSGPPNFSRPVAQYEGDDLLVATYLWPDLRFQYVASSKEQETAAQQPVSNPPPASSYELMVIASTQLYPNGWIDSAFASTHTIDGVSQILKVQVDHPESRNSVSPFALSITSVAGKEIGSYAITQVNRSGSVVVDSGPGLPQPYQLYVCSHPLGQPQWSCFEGIPREHSYIAPDVPLWEQQVPEGTPYQLLALAGPVPLPSLRGEYSDFMRYADTVSEPVTVQSTQPMSFRKWLSGWLESFDLVGPEKPPVWRLMLLLVLFLLGLIALLLLLEWLFATVSTLAGAVARIFDLARAALWRWQGELPQIDLAKFLLGIAIFVTVIYVIAKYYVALYVGVLSSVFAFPKNEAASMAVWLILLTAFLGLFIDLALKSARTSRFKKPYFLWLAASVLLMFAVALWFFEGYLYSSYLENLLKSKSPVVSAMGGIAFGLIAMVLTAAFFVVTELVLEPLRLLLVPLAYFLLSIIYLIFRFFEQLFLPFPKRNRNSSVTAAPIAAPYPGHGSPSSRAAQRSDAPTQDQTGKEAAVQTKEDKQ